MWHWVSEPSPTSPCHSTVLANLCSAPFLLVQEVWQHTDAGARAGSGCSLAPITPIPPHLGPQASPLGSCCVPKVLMGWRTCWALATSQQAQEVGHHLLWDSVRWGEGVQGPACVHAGHLWLWLDALICPSPVVSELGKRFFSP